MIGQGWPFLVVARHCVEPLRRLPFGGCLGLRRRSETLPVADPAACMVAGSRRRSSCARLTRSATARSALRQAGLSVAHCSHCTSRSRRSAGSGALASQHVIPARRTSCGSIRDSVRAAGALRKRAVCSALRPVPVICSHSDRTRSRRIWSSSVASSGVSSASFHRPRWLLVRYAHRYVRARQHRRPGTCFPRRPDSPGTAAAARP